MSSPPTHGGRRPPSSENLVLLVTKGFMLLERMEQLGGFEYGDSVIARVEGAILFVPEGAPLRSAALNLLAQLFKRRFKCHGDPEDINKAIKYSPQAVNTTPDTMAIAMLTNRGNLYADRFSAFGQRQDLERSLSFKVQAMCRAPSAPHDLAGMFSELGISLHSRFKHLKHTQDIDHAIMCQEQSLIGTRLHMWYPSWMMDLGRSLRDRFEYLGGKEDIDRSIKYLRRATELIPDNQIAHKARYLNNLAESLTIRFDHFAELADLDESILVLNDALLRGPGCYPERAESLGNLGYSLQQRYERLGDLADINQAILYQEEGVSLSLMNGVSSPIWIGNLGNSFLSRFEHLNDRTDLNEAIHLLEKALKSSMPSDVYRFRRLNNLGNSLQRRFKIEGKLEDIDASIRYLSEAISHTIEDNAYRLKWFATLGSSHKLRFECSNKVDDLNNAIKHQSYAISLTPDEHISKCEILDGLGRSYISRLQHLRNPLDLILGVETFHKAAILPSGKPSSRFVAALYCAKLSMATDNEFAMKHYEMAMNLLPRIVWLGNTIQRRYNDLAGIGSAATKAAAAAIQCQEYSLALEWLEQGRSIVWQQTLNLRTPLDELSQVAPALADRLQEIASQLDYMGAVQSTVSDVPNLTPTSEQAAQKHRRLAEDWERILEEVRRVPGFQRFMRPRAVSELVQSARFGAVVVINVDNSRCDALIVRPNSENVAHVPLPQLSLEKVATAYRQLIHSLQRKGVRERGIQVRQVQKVDMLESILSLLWSDVVEPVLESLGYTQSAPVDELPHITWCTTGPLAFLPLHAAGCYSKPESRVYNYAVSSYTPTLSTLISSGQSTHEFQGILAVGQTDTPGFRPLPGTTQELKCIRQQAQGVTYTQLDGEKATPAAVLEAIETHSWVHLACHASQDPSDPTASAFHLHDGALSLATIMQKSFKNAGLAFLSACQTAKGDADLPDEAVHLAAGMLMAGFPAVIATMWSIQDKDAPLIAEQVYNILLKDGKPDSRRAATALHVAVGRLREQVGEKTFTSWVPYVHLGI